MVVRYTKIAMDLNEETPEEGRSCQRFIYLKKNAAADAREQAMEADRRAKGAIGR
jgi:hypothetical protein